MMLISARGEQTPKIVGTAPSYVLFMTFITVSNMDAVATRRSL